MAQAASLGLGAWGQDARAPAPEGSGSRGLLGVALPLPSGGGSRLKTQVSCSSALVFLHLVFSQQQGS